MNIDIRKSVLANLNGINYDELKKDIEDAVSDGDEITLPGLGVMFEILWKNSSSSEKEKIISYISPTLN